MLKLVIQSFLLLIHMTVLIIIASTLYADKFIHLNLFRNYFPCLCTNSVINNLVNGMHNLQNTACIKVKSAAHNFPKFCA